MAKARAAAIEQELATLWHSEIAELKKQVEEREKAGGDLVAELAATVGEQIKRTKKEYAAFTKQGKPT